MSARLNILSGSSFYINDWNDWNDWKKRVVVLVKWLVGDQNGLKDQKLSYGSSTELLFMYILSIYVCPSKKTCDIYEHFCKTFSFLCKFRTIAVNLVEIIWLRAC